MRFHVEPSDVKGLFGPMSEFLWERLVTTQDPELVVREMDATVEAGSVRKPNKEREQSNLEAVVPVLLPILGQHAEATGDTEPINALIRLWGEAIDLDVSELQLGEQTQQPDPAAEQQAALEQQKAEAEQQKMQMEMDLKEREGEIKLALGQADLQMKQAEMEMDQQRFGMEIQQDAAQFQMDMRQQQVQHSQTLQQQKQQGALQNQLTKQKAKAAAQKPAAKNGKSPKKSA